MKITVIYRYFLPDEAAYSLLLAKMIPWFIEDDLEVSVYAGQPAYSDNMRGIFAPSRETLLGAQVRRVRVPGDRRSGKWSALAMILFSVRASFHVLLGPRRDVILFGTTPPVIQAFLTTLAAQIRGFKTIYQMQDIHPEIAVASGQMRRSIWTRILSVLDDYTIRNVTRVIVLSADMEKIIKEKTENKASVEVINNFAVNEIAESNKSPARKGHVRICFAGNIGNFQNLDAFVRAFAVLKRKDVTLEFLGDGKARKDLEQQILEAKLDNVFVHKRVSSEAAFAFMRNCDIGLVSLKPGLYPYAFPSKSQTYMSANLKILAMIEKESALSNIIEENNIGITIDWNAADHEIAKAIDHLVEDVIRDRNHSYIPKHLWHPDAAREKWAVLLKDLETEQADG